MTQSITPGPTVRRANGVSAKPWSGRGRPPSLVRRNDAYEPIPAQPLAADLSNGTWRRATWREGRNAGSDSQGRGWRGFHHPATLCIAAYGLLFAERATPVLPTAAIPRDTL